MPLGAGCLRLDAAEERARPEDGNGGPAPCRISRTPGAGGRQLATTLHFAMAPPPRQPTGDAVPTAGSEPPVVDVVVPAATVPVRDTTLVVSEVEERVAWGAWLLVRGNASHPAWPDAGVGPRGCPRAESCRRGPIRWIATALS